MIADLLSEIIEAASAIGVINSLARTCSMSAEYVRVHAQRLADERVTQMCFAGDQQSAIEMLPNRVPHGKFVYGGGMLVIRWDRGIATGWSIANERGCRDSYHIYTSTRHGRAFDYVLVGDRVHSQCGINYAITIEVMTGSITSRGPGGSQYHSDHRPLIGCEIDGELVPTVINAWVDKVLASSPWTIVEIEPVRPSICGTMHDDVRMLIGWSGLITVI